MSPLPMARTTAATAAGRWDGTTSANRAWPRAATPVAARPSPQAPNTFLHNGQRNGLIVRRVAGCEVRWYAMVGTRRECPTDVGSDSYESGAKLSRCTKPGLGRASGVAMPASSRNASTYGGWPLSRRMLCMRAAPIRATGTVLRFASNANLSVGVIRVTFFQDHNIAEQRMCNQNQKR